MSNHTPVPWYITIGSNDIAHIQSAYKNGYQWAVSAAARLNRAIKKAEGETE